MKTKLRFFAALITALLLVPCVLGLCGCKKELPNALSELPEVMEINENSKLPYPLGTLKSDIGDGYEYFSGPEGHFEMMRSKKNTDVIYYLSTLDFHYGEDVKEELYAVSVRISPENREVKKNPDGSTYVEYTTNRSVLGIKIGDHIEGAERKLEEYGYENIIREKPNSNLPQTLEYSYSKGNVILTLGVEINNGVLTAISQIYLRIPYKIEEIDLFNSESKLPANLGISYSVTANADFERDKSKDTSYSHYYHTQDGSDAVLRGFPDYTDQAMTAYVSFTSTEYNVLGINVGADAEQAAAKLQELGWTREGERFTKGIIIVTLQSAEDGTVKLISAELAESTNLTNIDLSTKAPQS